MTDAALLWADEHAPYGTARHYGVMGFRAGQSHDAELLAALEECVTVLTAETIGTIYEDDPAWYAAIDRAVPRARAAIAAAKGA